MAWGVRSYLVGSIVLGVLGVLAGCSGSMFFAEREPWRHDAEVQCLGTGMIKEGRSAAADPTVLRRPCGFPPAPPLQKYPPPRGGGPPGEVLSPGPYGPRPLVDPPATLRNGSSGIIRGPLREPPAPPSARETV